LIKTHSFVRTSTLLRSGFLQVVAWTILWKFGQWKVWKLLQSSFMFTFSVVCCISLTDFCQCCHRILGICWKIIFMDWPSIKVSNKTYPVSGMLSIYNHLRSFLFANYCWCLVLMPFKPTCFFPFRSWVLQYTLTLLIVQDGLVTSSCQRYLIC